MPSGRGCDKFMFYDISRIYLSSWHFINVKAFYDWFMWFYLCWRLKHCFSKTIGTVTVFFVFCLRDYKNDLVNFSNDVHPDKTMFTAFCRCLHVDQRVERVIIKRIGFIVSNRQHILMCKLSLFLHYLTQFEDIYSNNMLTVADGVNIDIYASISS